MKIKNAETENSTVDIDKNKCKNILIKFSSSVLLLFVIIFFYTFSWFTMNKNDYITGSNMKSSALPFELKTEGVKGFLDSYLDSSYKKLESDSSGVLTTNDEQSIQWLVTEDYNANNYKDNDTNEDDIGIHPGSHGSLHFWIVPKERQTIKINYNLKITPYKKQYPNTTDGKTDYDAEPSPVALGDSDNTLAAYVDSHILFFRHYDGEYYSDMIDDDFEEEINFTQKNGKLQPYEVNVYWVWPETLGEAVLANSSKGVICQTKNDTNEVLEKLNKKPSAFLKGYEGDKLTQEYITQHYSTLSIQYNNADEDIGNYIMFLIAEMTVSLAN